MIHCFHTIHHLIKSYAPNSLLLLQPSCMTSRMSRSCGLVPHKMLDSF